MKKLICALALFFCLLAAAAAEETVKCDTQFNGAVGLPITWTCESAVKWTVYDASDNSVVYSCDGSCCVFTPSKAGQYIAVALDPDGGAIQSEEVGAAAAVYLGLYEQDGKDEGLEPIEWTVLTVRDGKALLISKYILHNNSYFNPWWIKYKYTYWAYSYIGDFPTNYWGSQPEDPSRLIRDISADNILMEDRTRGTEESLYNSELHCRYWCNTMFYNAAFSDDDKARVLLTLNTNPDNPESKVDGGPDTEDYVFFLSYEEVQKYMKTADSRKCSQTAAAKSEGRNNDSSYWWLRTPGKFRVNAAIVYGSNGHVTLYGTDVGHSQVGYRPCVWIKIGG